MTPIRLALIAAGLVAAPATAQMIVALDYRPPETVQRVAIPLNPAEKRLQVWSSAAAIRTSTTEPAR